MVKDIYCVNEECPQQYTPIIVHPGRTNIMVPSCIHSSGLDIT